MTIKFDMKVEQNHASFYDPETKDFVIVESFNNKDFEVRLGDLSSSRKLGTVYAKEDDQLNAGLFRLLAPHLKRLPTVDLGKETMESLEELVAQGLETSDFISKMKKWRTKMQDPATRDPDLYILERTRLAIEYLEKRQVELEGNRDH